jgi:hypothetical protein
MRVLKRDLPLTILIDILVQIVFVLSVVFALEILDGDSRAGLVDPKPLLAEIDLLKSKIAALEEETKGLKGALAEAEARGFARQGKKDCFSPPNLAVVYVTWLGDEKLRIERGEVFPQLLRGNPEADALLGTIDTRMIDEHFSLVRRYSEEHSCLMTVRFFYPDGTLKREWEKSWVALYRVFERGSFRPE